MQYDLDRCYFGDVRAVLRDMIAAGVQVHTIVTSPPYWGLRSYLPAGHPDKPFEIGSEPTVYDWVRGMVEVFELLRQVLRDDGTAWVNLGDNYAAARSAGGSMSGDVGHRAEQPAQGLGGFKPKDLIGQPWRLAFALQDAGWWLRQDIIWNKPNPMPESIRDRCTKAHEYVFLLAKSERYYYDFEAMQEPVAGTAHARKPSVKGWATEGDHNAQAWATMENQGRGVGWGYADGDAAKPRTRKLAESGSGTKLNESYDAAIGRTGLVTMRNRRSVWTVASEPYSGSHFATYPTELVTPCILAGCPPGGVVLDPFFGSGTTGQVALDLGRHFLGIDLNRDNEALQAQRLATKSMKRRQHGLDFEDAAA